MYFTMCPHCASYIYKDVSLKGQHKTLHSQIKLRILSSLQFRESNIVIFLVIQLVSNESKNYCITHTNLEVPIATKTMQAEVWSFNVQFNFIDRQHIDSTYCTVIYSDTFWHIYHSIVLLYSIFDKKLKSSMWSVWGIYSSLGTWAHLPKTP